MEQATQSVGPDSTTEIEPTAIPERYQISILIIYSAILVLSVMANILIVLVLWKRFRRHRKTTRDKSFIVVVSNQAVSHLAFVVVTIPVTLANHSSPEWSFGPVWCKIVLPLQAAALLAMVYSYVVLLIHQFLGMKRGLLSQMKFFPAAAMTCVIWICSIVTAISYALKLDYNHDSKTCTRHWVFAVLLALLPYIPSFPIIIFLYYLAVEYLKRFRDICPKHAGHHQRRKCILRMFLFSFVALLMSVPFTMSFVALVPLDLSYTVFAFLNAITYSLTFLNPVMFFVFNPDFKRDLWHLIKCHYIKKEERVFSFKHPSESFSEESDSPLRSLARPQPFDDCNESVYPSTPTLTRAEVYSMSLENNSEVARVKASIVLSAVGQLGKAEKEIKSSSLESLLSLELIYENTDEQSANSFDQEPRNTSEVGAGDGDLCEVKDGSSKHEIHGKRLLMFQKSNEDIHSVVQQSTKRLPRVNCRTEIPDEIDEKSTLDPVVYDSAKYNCRVSNEVEAKQGSALNLQVLPSTHGANFPISVAYKAASRGTQWEDTVVVNMLQEPKDILQELTSVTVNPLKGQSIAKTGTK